MNNNITNPQHRTLATMTASMGKTLKGTVVQRPFAPDRNQVPELQELKALLEQRLGEANRGEFSAEPITDIANEIIGNTSATR